MKMRHWLLAISCALMPVVAQADSTAVAPVNGPWWVGVWTGGAVNSPFGTRHGERERDYYMAGLRVGRTMHASPLLAFDYFIDVVPWVRSTNNPVKYYEVQTCKPAPGSQTVLLCTTTEVMETATAKGFALTPVGLQMRAWQGRPVELVVGASFGAVRYDQRIPDPGEKRLNFVADVNLGVQVRTDPGGSVIGGFRLNHMSNASTGEVNPGLDSRVLYVGLTRSLHRRAKP